MKYIIIALLLIGSAKGQDTSLRWSNGLTMDNSKAIHISLDTPWLLTHGWKLVDTVKWKPYYQKKKHQPYKDTTFSNGDLTFTGAAPQLGGLITQNTTISGKTFKLTIDSLDSVALDHGYFQNGVFYSRAGGGNFHKNISRADCDPPMAGCVYDSNNYRFIYDGSIWHVLDTPGQRAAQDSEFRTLMHDTLPSDKDFSVLWTRDLWLPVYPWYKKALWVLLGVLVGFLGTYAFAIFSTTKSLK